MTWYFAIQNERRGPVSAAELSRLSREGVVGPDDLAWREGMAEWAPFRDVADEVRAEAGESPGAMEETAACAFSGRVMPKSEMIPYGDRWIDPRHKEAFLQRIMETGETAASLPDAGAMIPVGFWWRALAYFIDNLIMVIPSILCMVPYYIASFAGAFSPDSGSENPFTGWTLAMGLTYVLGIVASTGVGLLYHSWMVVKYQATVGKMAVGAKVAQPDGTPLRWGRAIGRYFCAYWLNMLISVVVMAVLFGIGAALMALLVRGDSGGAMAATGVLVMLLFGGVGIALGLFPFWMAGLDEEKRALHDRICATRVVKKL